MERLRNYAKIRKLRKEVLLELSEERKSVLVLIRSTDQNSDEYCMLLKRLKEICDIEENIRSSDRRTLEAWMPLLKVIGGVLTCAAMEKICSIVFTGKAITFVR